MRPADSDGKYPLTTREYDALRTVFGALNALDSETLKERLQTTKSGWRDMRLCAVTMHKVLMSLLDTIPADKLLTLRDELNQTVCEVRLRTASQNTRDSVFVSHRAMISLIDRAIQMECMLCEKSVKKGKRCPLYKDICACFPYELDTPTDTRCPFAGVSHLKYTED